MKTALRQLKTKLGKNEVRKLLMVFTVVCGMVACYATIAIVKIKSIEFANADDQVASMEPYQAAPFKRLQREHTALVVNGDLTNTRIENGKFKAKVSSNGGGAESASRGIAFCVSQPGYFLTAGHCVNGGEDIYLVPRGRKLHPKDLEQYRAQIIWRSSDEDDLVLLQAAGLDMSPMRLASELPEPGTPVFSLGYRLAAGKVIDVNASPHSARADGPADAIIPQVFRMRNNAPLMKGDSGAPLVNDEGEVIGVSIFGTKKAELLQALCLQGDVPTFTASFLPQQELAKLVANIPADIRSDSSGQSLR